MNDGSQELRLGVKKVKHVGEDDQVLSGTYSGSTGFIRKTPPDPKPSRRGQTDNSNWEVLVCK